MNQEDILKQAAEAARQHQAPSVVPPMPVPMSMQLTSGRGQGGEQYVILILQTPVGQHIYHFDPESAENLAEGLVDTARVARTGLEIAKV